MVSISTFTSSNLLQKPSNPLTFPKPLVSLQRRVFVDTVSFESCRANSDTCLYFLCRRSRTPGRISVVAQEAQVSVQGETDRKLYVGNIPRNVNSSELAAIFGEYGSVEKAEVMYDKYSGRSRRFGFVTMSTIEDTNAAVEKLNGSEIGGRQIKVNVTEKPLLNMGFSLPQAEEFIDSPYKVYVGNLAKSVTTKILTEFFSEKGKVLSAKVSRVPGTSKSSGFGFVSFSSDDDVEAAISSFNNTLLEGQRIRVNKA